MTGSPILRIRRLLVLLPVLSLLAAGCGGGTPGAPVKLAGKTNNHGSKSAKEGLTVEADDYYFGPTFLTATAGQHFTVEVSNNGSSRHSFTSEDMGVDLELAPGARRTISLTAPASGATEFHCRFHQSQGMQGAVYVK